MIPPRGFELSCYRWLRGCRFSKDGDIDYELSDFHFLVEVFGGLLLVGQSSWCCFILCLLDKVFIKFKTFEWPGRGECLDPWSSEAYFDREHCFYSLSHFKGGSVDRWPWGSSICPENIRKLIHPTSGYLFKLFLRPSNIVQLDTSTWPLAWG